MVYEKDYGTLESRTGSFRDYNYTRGSDSEVNYWQWQKPTEPLGPVMMRWDAWKKSLWQNSKRLRYLEKIYPIGPKSKNHLALKNSIRMYAHQNSKLQYRFIILALNAWFVGKYVWPILNTQNRFDNAVEYRWKRHNEFIGGFFGIFGSKIQNFFIDIDLLLYFLIR